MEREVEFWSGLGHISRLEAERHLGVDFIEADAQRREDHGHYVLNFGQPGAPTEEVHGWGIEVPLRSNSKPLHSIIQHLVFPKEPIRVTDAYLPLKGKKPEIVGRVVSGYMAPRRDATAAFGILFIRHPDTIARVRPVPEKAAAKIRVLASFVVDPAGNERVDDVLQILSVELADPAYRFPGLLEVDPDRKAA